MIGSIVTQKQNIFQRVREIPFREVFREFRGGEIRHGKAACPFHSERTPSFHLYQNGFYCFGCSEAGDAVHFVGKLLNLQPLRAAQLIAERFGLPVQSGPLSRDDLALLARQQAERLREKRLREAFDTWCRTAGARARLMTEAIKTIMDGKGVEVDGDLLPIVHLLPVFEYWANTLLMGTDEEKVALYRDPAVRGWFPCRT